MLRLNTLLVMALVLSLTSCSEEPLVTAADPDAVAMQNESIAKGGATVTKDLVLDEQTDVNDGPYFIPCLNGGVGEEVNFTISYLFVAHKVITPSGNVHYNGWLDEFDSEFTGVTTGDR